MDIIEGLKKKNKRALARFITLIENEDPKSIEILKELYDKTGNAKVIGITGAPGVGKSTLTDKLIKQLRKENKRVGVIAIDPSSPFGGGAILGDRIRMNDLSMDKGVFIRSMGTRGSLGGLSKAVHGAINAMDIYGMDYIFIETVGVGQSEVDIIKVAGSVILVLAPGFGDDIQAIKAGIMEIGNIFVVNKSDRDGANKTATEIKAMLDLNTYNEYIPPVLKAVAETGEGIEGILLAVEEHDKYMQNSGEGYALQKKQIEEKLLDVFYGNILQDIRKLDSEIEIVKKLVESVHNKSTDLYTAAEMLYERSLKNV